MSTATLEWTTDVLGAPFECATLALAPDAQGEVVATLVRRTPVGGSRRAVLYVHGFCDYFFQTDLAAWWVGQGYDFYALDLRKYGRSLRQHQTPNMVLDLAAYYEELDLAWSVIRADHDEVVVTAHSTGGLTAPLWAYDRRLADDGLVAMVLNAPWLDMMGDLLTRRLLIPFVRLAATVKPDWAVPRRVTGVYVHALHRQWGGEWDFDLAWKPEASFDIHAGWMAAVRDGHDRVATGLDVGAPVLVVTSTRHAVVKDDHDPLRHTTDIVVDVEQTRARAGLLSRHVTLAQVKDAIHDTVLSREPARTEVYAEMARFMQTHVPS